MATSNIVFYLLVPICSTVQTALVEPGVKPIYRQSFIETLSKLHVRTFIADEYPDPGKPILNRAKITALPARPVFQFLDKAIGFHVYNFNTCAALVERDRLLNLLGMELTEGFNCYGSRGKLKGPYKKLQQNSDIPVPNPKADKKECVVPEEP